MSITKDAGPPKQIKFSYTYTELFEVVSLTTNVIAETILDDKNVAMLDEYGITEDEKYTVTQKMYNAADKVFGRLMKITNGVTDSVVLSDSSIECSILDKEAYNQNVLEAIDRYIKDALINYIIKDWFLDKNKLDYAKIYETKYYENIKDITKRSVQLRKSVIT